MFDAATERPLDHSDQLTERSKVLSNEAITLSKRLAGLRAADDRDAVQGRKHEEE
jgi:hypothetical protein